MYVFQSRRSRRPATMGGEIDQRSPRRHAGGAKDVEQKFVEPGLAKAQGGPPWPALRAGAEGEDQAGGRGTVSSGRSSGAIQAQGVRGLRKRNVAS